MCRGYPTLQVGNLVGPGRALHRLTVDQSGCVMALLGTYFEHLVVMCGTSSCCPSCTTWRYLSAVATGTVAETVFMSQLLREFRQNQADIDTVTSQTRIVHQTVCPHCREGASVSGAWLVPCLVSWPVNRVAFLRWFIRVFWLQQRPCQGCHTVVKEYTFDNFEAQWSLARPFHLWTWL